MLAVTVLLTLVALGVFFDRMWARGAQTIAVPVSSRARGTAAPPAPRRDLDFRAELDRVLHILDSSVRPGRNAPAADPVSASPAHAARKPLPRRAARKPRRFSVIDDFDPSRDFVVIEVDEARLADAVVSLRAARSGVGTMLAVDGVDYARVVSRTGRFDAGMVRLVPAA